MGNSCIFKKWKWLTNICVDSDSTIELKYKSKNIQLLFTQEKKYHPEQIAFDQKHAIISHSLEQESVYYAVYGNIHSPNKILITFPGVSNMDNVHHRLSALTSLHSKLKNVLIIAFQDKEGVYGNYMFKTLRNYSIRPIVVSLIYGLKTKYSLNNEDIIFYGNSKGATIAIDYINKFPDSYFFIDIPQLDLYNYKSQNDLFRYTLGEEARKYYFYKESLPKLENERVFYSFGENDHDSSCAIPIKNFSGINVSMLKDMKHSGSAMELVKKNFVKILQLITGRTAIIRQTISAKCLFKNGRLYFDRVLPAFDNVQKIEHVYAEVNFKSINQSINQCFIK